MNLGAGPNSEQDRPTWSINLATVIASSLLLFLLQRFAGTDAALAAAGSLIANILVVSFYWKQRSKGRLWITISSIAALEFLIELYIPWPQEPTLRLALFGVVVVNAFVTACLLRLTVRMQLEH